MSENKKDDEDLEFLETLRAAAKEFSDPEKDALFFKAAAAQNLYHFKPELLVQPEFDPTNSWCTDYNWQIEEKDLVTLGTTPKTGKRLTFCEAFRMRGKVLETPEMPSKEFQDILRIPLSLWAFQQGYYVELDLSELADDLAPKTSW